MAQAKKFEFLLSRAEEGEALTEDQMVSATMSLLSARRGTHGGGRPKTRRKCPFCKGVIEGPIKDFLVHVEICENSAEKA